MITGRQRKNERSHNANSKTQHAKRSSASSSIRNCITSQRAMRRTTSVSARRRSSSSNDQKHKKSNSSLEASTLVLLPPWPFSRDLWEDVVEEEEEEEEEENTRGKRARARAPDMRNIAKALDEAIDILDPEDILDKYWKDLPDEEEMEQDEENTRGKRARARAPDMRKIAKELDEAIDILDPEDILSRRRRRVVRLR